MKPIIKRLALAAIPALLAIGLISHAAPRAKSIAWQTDFKKGLADAARQNKIAMVDFYAQGCSACALLDRKTYTNPKVIALADKFIPIKLDAGKPGSDKIAEKYKGSITPTIVFMDSKGKQVHYLFGYLPPDAFAKEMQKALKNAAKK
jgi:thiol:disulfide interchange protein